MSVVRDCLFDMFAATLRAVVTGNRITQKLGEIILQNEVLKKKKTTKNPDKKETFYVELYRNSYCLLLKIVNVKF